MLEIGIFEHQGNRFAANGATCNGRELTAYVKDDHDSPVTLTDWHGNALVMLRSVVGKTWIVNDFRDEAETLLLRCGNGHWIGGLSLGGGMLFRGEHFVADDENEALRQADEIARIWAEIDYSDSLADQEEQRQECEEDE